MADATVLVTGATGKQGGAVARALLQEGRPVRALVRDPSSAGAQRLAEAGAELAQGDLDDPASLPPALTGVEAVFSIETANYADIMADFEVQRARNLVDAARSAGVRQIVHSSVSGAGVQDPAAFDAERWGAFPVHYWRSKQEAEEVVRRSGVASWTILRPATFMENLQAPSIWFIGFTSDQLAFAGSRDLPRPWVAVDDIGAAARAAFADPARFHGIELELAGDLLPMTEAVAILDTVRESPIQMPDTPEQALEWGVSPELATSQRRSDAFPAPARPEMAQALDVPMTTFAEWAQRTAAS